MEKPRARKQFAVAAGTFPRNAPEGGEWSTNRHFYQTKPTGLLESTKDLGKKVKKPPIRRNETTDRGVMQWLLAIATRLRDRRGRAEKRPILLGGVCLRRVERSVQRGGQYRQGRHFRLPASR